MNAAIIIPAFDPDENLIHIVDRVWDLGNQVIVVDDGSEASKAGLFERLCIIRSWTLKEIIIP